MCKGGYMCGMWTLDRSEPVWLTGTTYVRTTDTTYTTSRGAPNTTKKKDTRGVTWTCNREQDRER